MAGISRSLGYIGRFSIINLITYSLIAYIFLSLLDVFPASWRLALDFFEPYRYPDISVMISQLIQGVLLALIILPFYEIIVKSKYGLFILFGALWGLGLLASVEPMPGSIEGMIYTRTTSFEHFAVLTAVAVQTLIFCVLFLHWERRSNTKEKGKGKGVFLPELHLTETLSWTYIRRFTLLHIITYWVVGMIFYQFQGYEEALATMEAFELYRPLENFPMVAVVFLGQIVRGIILALLIYPFYRVFTKKQHGWLLLFGLLWIITGIGSTFFTPEFLESIIGFRDTLEGLLHELKIGVPEITVQMLLFSWLFCKWDKKNKRHKNNNSRASIVINRQTAS